MPTTPVFAVTIALTTVGPGNFLTLVLSSIKAFIVTFISLPCLFLIESCCILCFFLGPSLAEVAPTFWFEIGSNFAIVPDPMSESIAFFTRFNQAKTNDLDLADF